MEISEFKERVHALLTEPETADLPDEVWWERFGELLDDVLAVRARARRAQRELTRCASWLDRCVVRCTRTQGHLGNHFNVNTRDQWSDE